VRPTTAQQERDATVAAPRARRRLRTRAVPHPEAAPFVPDLVWTPVAAGLLVLTCGVLSLAFRQIWLFPSIGPTALLQAHSPHRESARFYNVVVGHLIGLGAGYLALALLHALHAPTPFATHAIPPVRVWASALAVALGLFGQMATRSPHPPAAATMLLVALGAFGPTLHDVASVLVGVLLVASVGEALRFVQTRWLGGAPDDA
jgi:hypothetical protein